MGGKFDKAKARLQSEPSDYTYTEAKKNMKNILEYKGYYTKIEYSAEDRLLYGKIEGIKDIVNFESAQPDEIEEEFHNAVDDYLALCKELGQSPDRSYSGTFNIRVSPALHRLLALEAYKRGETLNSTVESALRAYVDQNHPRA